MHRSLMILIMLAAPCLADGPKDNLADAVRPIPPPGIEVPAEELKELQTGLGELTRAIDAAKKKTRLGDLLPDVQIFERAVRSALDYHEFFDKKDLKKAKGLLAVGIARANALALDRAPWSTQTGLVVRGYRSRIDGSVQPYGMVVPASYCPQNPGRYRLDLWFHGRGETLSEVNFLDQRMTQPGQFTPADTLVLHPYGRYCNANKFAGEIDPLEALEDAKRKYRVDDQRLAVRGFSMGGAACWQFAVHYADRWFAANPGAGFAETPEFLKVFQSETVAPTWYEKKLWQWYDCPGYAGNLAVCPTVAYSGEIDKQKQAADIMSKALTDEQIELRHVIGPQTAHKYHPDAAKTVEGLLASIATRGRNPLPRHLDFTTYTLIYPQFAWLRLDGLDEQWKQARVKAMLEDENVTLKTENVSDLTLEIPAGWAPFDLRQPVQVAIDAQELTTDKPKSDRSWSCSLHRENDKWVLGKRSDAKLRKQPGLCGPIDHAFMDSFLFVKPGGKSKQPVVEKWVENEMHRAIEHWRRQFRGHARVKFAAEVTADDIAGANLVLWGDPDSNALIQQIADKLPIRWQGDQLVAGDQRFSAADHAPVLVYPNPLNPQRYVVLNSSFTYREYDYLNNARQVAKLPDWAIVDLRTPPDTRFPGKIVAADFFDEAWKLKPAHSESTAGK